MTLHDAHAQEELGLLVDACGLYEVVEGLREIALLNMTPLPKESTVRTYYATCADALGSICGRMKL